MIESHSQQSAAAKPRRRKLSPRQHFKVLLAEDNPQDALQLRKTLNSSVYTTFEIVHVEWLSEVRQHLPGDFDVILLDIFLPDSSGLATLAAVYDIAPRVPIIVLANLDSEAVAVEAMQAGAQDYFVKGHSSMHALVRTVRLACERAQVQEALRFITEASVELSSSLNHDDTFSQVLDLGISGLADCCILDVIGPGGLSGRTDVRHVDPVQEDVLRAALASSWRIVPENSHLRPGALNEPRIFPQMARRFPYFCAYDSDRFLILPDVGFISGMTLPLRARGSFMGTMSFFRSHSSQHYSKHEISLAQELSARCALALDNARLYQQAQASLEARESLLSAVSHDLRTPLTAARAGVGLLEMRMRERLQPDEARLLGNIQSSIDRLGMLINDLLTYNEIEAGILTLERGTVDLRNLISAAISTMHVLVEKKSQHLQVDIPEPLLCEGDARRLGPVFMNLLDNAHRHTPAGTTITISGRTEEKGVKLVVSDNGPGIPEEEHELIFKRFHRITTAKGGLGLGLAMARAIIEMHKGRLWVESRPGEGSTFHILLPKATEEEL